MDFIKCLIGTKPNVLISVFSVSSVFFPLQKPVQLDAKDSVLVCLYRMPILGFKLHILDISLFLLCS